MIAVAARRTILVCDRDPATARALAPALRRRGWQVRSVRDGARALQLAILRPPDVVLLEEESPLLDAETFVRILRTNPRTERIPVLLTGAAGGARPRAGPFLPKPLAPEEVAARADEAARRALAARAAAASPGAELTGSLAQMALPDLLQVLAMSRKTGRLEIEAKGVRGAVALDAGRIVDASFGRAGGEKALYRIVALREGRFAFEPGRSLAAPPLDRRVDEAVLDGLRRADEVLRLAPALPGADEEVALAIAPGELPPDLHPATAEVAALIASPRALEDVLDEASVSDLEASRALAALLARGLAVRHPRRVGEGAPCALLGVDALHALRARVAHGRASGSQAAGKVMLAGGDPMARRAALLRLVAVPGFSACAEPAGTLGTVGSLALDGGLRVDLVALPGERALFPAWRPFAAGALGALVLLPADEVAGPLAALARAERLVLAACGPPELEWPPALREGPGAIGFRGTDAAEALRAILAGGRAG